MYGTKFADLWAGCDIESVKAKWVDKLRGFSDHPGVIQKAIDALDERPNPPTLPEFLGLCREAAKRMGTATPALPHKPTAEDEARARQAAEQAAKAIKSKVSDGIDVHWATHPSSHRHFKAIFEAAQSDVRFRPHLESMVSDGVCTADGHLLKTYRDGQWWPVHRHAA